LFKKALFGLEAKEGIKEPLRFGRKNPHPNSLTHSLGGLVLAPLGKNLLF